MQNHGRLALDGVSVGGVATSLDIAEFKVCIDLGRLLESAVSRSTILLTHGHADHVGALAQHAAQRGLRRLPPASYVAPAAIMEPLGDLMNTWRSMDRGAFEVDLKPVAEGDEVLIGRDVVGRAFETDHRVPAVGYVIEQRRLKLKEHFRGLAAAELARLRAAGNELDAETRKPVLAVTGDTRIEGILGRSDVLSSPVLVLECTFLDDRVDARAASERGHVHIDDIARNYSAFECEQLVLYHVSPRHSTAEARDLVRQRLPSALAERTTVFPNRLSGGRLELGAQGTP